MAGMLQQAAAPHFLVDAADTWTQKETAARGWTHSNFCSGEFWTVAPRPAAILIDTREKPGLIPFISAAREWGVPVVSIHDLGLNPLPSDTVIDGSLLPGDRGRTSVPYYAGTRYLVLDPAYAAVRKRPRITPRRIRSVLINLGGGDSKRFFLKVLQGLKLWNRELEAVGLRGFAAWGQDEVQHENWLPNHFRWAEPNESVAELFHNADLAITAGGTAAFEALCAGAPLMALSYDEFQHRAVAALSAFGCCTDLGPGSQLRPEMLPPLLAAIDGNPRHREESSRRGMRLVDGKGAKRVAEVVVRIIRESGRAGLAGTSGRLSGRCHSLKAERA